MIELILLRHGESVWNAEDRYQGQQGTGLSARGRDQAKAAAEYLQSFVFDAIVASDLQRVQETLEPYVGNQDVQVDRRWREIDVGTWSGRTFAEVYAEEPEVVTAFARGEDVARGGGETFRQLRTRVAEAIRELTTTTSSGARRVLVGTHGGPIRAAAAGVLGLPAGREMVLEAPGNCSLTVLRSDRLVGYNVPTGVER
ncbi:histidine phosphatase family protein [Kribbella karoonensis]|uniref:Histidine phosphatase family protein n=1 Tax=Kribbella karoonensis TaxID=324851 RepID=A0ABN2EGX9_9ACTN